MAGPKGEGGLDGEGERESVFVRICRTRWGGEEGGARHLVYPIGVETQLVSLCIPAGGRRISRYCYTTLFFSSAPGRSIQHLFRTYVSSRSRWQVVSISGCFFCASPPLPSLVFLFPPRPGCGNEWDATGTYRYISGEKSFRPFSPFFPLSILFTSHSKV